MIFIFAQLYTGVIHRVFIPAIGGFVVVETWGKCLSELQRVYSQEEFNTWLRPLQPKAESDNKTLLLYAPNAFVCDWIKQHYLEKIYQLMKEQYPGNEALRVIVEIGDAVVSPSAVSSREPVGAGQSTLTNKKVRMPNQELNEELTFESFVEGKSNQLARAAALQIAENPGKAYNPLLIYGEVGLGKTHIMSAVGNFIRQTSKDAQVAYLHSERFVANMVRALQTNTMDDFKAYYRSVDALLVDDIQFFAGKGRSQEEFFHTFNILLERGTQVIMTSDRYPKEIEGLEDRLKSRFSWGLTVVVDPPELETRVAILMSKAEKLNVDLPYEVAFFIAKRIRSNVRELEGALRRVIANAQFTNKVITLDFVKEALRDLLAIQEKLISVANIQKTVAEYYKIKVSDLQSHRRSRSIARPRQVAMALAKELTSRSLPEIGDAFGGRDHTTVLHACRKIKELQSSDVDIKEDYSNLLRILTS